MDAVLADVDTALFIDWVVIAAATGNQRSRAVPERLGFKFEGMLRECEELYGTFVDHAVYSQLRAEFDALL